ncbi:hypothetical protein MPC1_4750005 [Methylocella tundrae]|nr:hypothetical protein MPC1_4750005 [Methylocella tundrae]
MLDVTGIGFPKTHARSYDLIKTTPG